MQDAERTVTETLEQEPTAMTRLIQTEEISVPVIFSQQSQITILRFLPHLVIRKPSHEEKGDSKCFEKKTPCADVNQQRHLTHKWSKGLQFVAPHSLPHVPGHPSPTAL